MKLENVAAGSDVVDPASDRELARDVLAKLMLAGLLDPPVDGAFGAVSDWALGAFASQHDLSAMAGLSPDLAKILLKVEAASIPRLDLSLGDLAARAAGVMLAAGFWISRHPDCVNIVYFEGVDKDGTLNDDRPNRFNDLRLVFRVGSDLRPFLLGAWEGTTEPGAPFTANPLDPNGAARIVFGQYESWNVGIHKANSPSAHLALVQVADVVVARDKNKDGKRTGDRQFTGVFGINQHWGFDNPVDNVGKASAGCLVGRTKAGHREFMAIVGKDPRFGVNRGYRFMTAVMDGAAMSAALPPANPAAPSAPAVAKAVAPVLADPALDDTWIETALRVTGHFEDSSDPMAAVTGDFDGMGISLGVLQWNIGSGSLQPLVKAVGRPAVISLMPVFGAELWEACNSDRTRGLAIARSWHSGTTLRPPVRKELNAFTGSPAFVAQQINAARTVAETAFRSAVIYATEDPSFGQVTKRLFCWFFDVITQNGGLKGLGFRDVHAFIDAAGVDRADDLVCEFLGDRGPSDAGFRDSRENAVLWRDKIPAGRLSLLTLSYLRGLKSRTEFRGDVLNRKGTIAVGSGMVHRERHDLNVLLGD